MRFAKWTFRIAGIYGLIALIPLYFRRPPATHAEFFYGFIGIAIAWQIVFLVIAGNVARFRPIMPAAVLEKVAFGVPALILFSQGRLATEFLVAGILDLVLAVLFAIALMELGKRQQSYRTPSD